ncbi:MAG TPA: hypothetical protein VFY91_08080 [Microbacterium sp.]|nr:hypothetical protein [Microbacterium sp.]
MVTPVSVRVRTYQVGFGDCFLITVGYRSPLADGRRERHLLVDFGAKVLAKGGPTIADVAEKIAEHSGGQLDVVVVTHRHQDHVRGFGDKKAQKHLDALAPSMIIRPWTDMPEPARAGPDTGLGPDSRGFLGLLDALSEHSRAVDDQFALDQRVLAERARALAQLGISNVDALAMLDVWVPAERTRWVRAGDVVDIAQIVPGVRLEALGPPTLEQVPGMRSYASSSAEYWLGLTGADSIRPQLMAPRREDALLEAKETVAQPGGLGRPSWLLDRLHERGPRQVLDIVEGFDDVLNNTSLVLLLTVGRRTLLLTGDAQVENWSHPLDRAYGANGHPKDRSLRGRLANVDLYKVGHHGSRNATPRRLVDLWRQQRRSGHPLCSILSTRDGVYGSTAEGRVPKPDLVDALRALGELHTTEQLPKGVWWFDVEAPTKSRAEPFQYSPGPPQG